MGWRRGGRFGYALLSDCEFTADAMLKKLSAIRGSRSGSSLGGSMGLLSCPLFSGRRSHIWGSAAVLQSSNTATVNVLVGL